MAKARLMRLTDWGLHTHARPHARTVEGRTVREWKLSTVHLHHPAVAAQVFGFLAHLFKVGKAACGRREREKEGTEACQSSHWTTHRLRHTFIHFS